MSAALSDAEIAHAVRKLYDKAEINLERRSPSIAPLAELTATFNIRMEELSDLSYATAKAFLEKAMQCDVSMPNDGKALAGFLYAQQANGYDYVAARCGDSPCALGRYGHRSASEHGNREMPSQA